MTLGWLLALAVVVMGLLWSFTKIDAFIGGMYIAGWAWVGYVLYGSFGGRVIKVANPFRDSDHNRGR